MNTTPNNTHQRSGPRIEAIYRGLNEDETDRKAKESGRFRGVQVCNACNMTSIIKGEA
jgi:hypothetical protein